MSLDIIQLCCGQGQRIWVERFEELFLCGEHCISRLEIKWSIMNVKIQERAYQVVIEYLLKELMMKCCSGTTRHAFYNLDLLTLQRCHRHRNALSKRNRFRSFCYEKCCSKPFQSLETPLFLPRVWLLVMCL